MKKYGLINHKDGQEALAEKLGIPGMRGQLNPAGILSAAESARCLDTLRLTRLEDSFRNWARASVRSDIRASRRRILLIFLLIRHTGARLNEILTMNMQEQADFFKPFDLTRFNTSIRHRPSIESEVTVTCRTHHKHHGHQLA